MFGWGQSRSREGGSLTLQDAAGTLLWPRGLGAQDGPDRLVKDGLQASLGEGRALQVFYRVWGGGVGGTSRRQKPRSGRALGRNLSRARPWGQGTTAQRLHFLMPRIGSWTSKGEAKTHRGRSEVFLDTAALNLWKAGRSLDTFLGGKGAQVTVTESLSASVSSRNFPRRPEVLTRTFKMSSDHSLASPHFTGEDTEVHRWGIVCPKSHAECFSSREGWLGAVHEGPG